MRLLHAMCCMAALVLAVFAVMPAAAAPPSVSVVPVSGRINIFSSPDCSVSGPSSTSFTINQCVPIPLYFNTAFTWMIVRTDASNAQWQILAFKGGNCNGQGDEATKPDAFIVGAGSACKAAGVLGSFNFNSVIVTVDPVPVPASSGAISICADSGCATSIISVPFTSGACMTIAHFNENYTSVVFTATAGSDEWLIQAFKGINCNGEYPGSADAMVQGQSGACTQAGKLVTYNFKAFVVRIDPVPAPQPSGSVRMCTSVDCVGAINSFSFVPHTCMPIANGMSMSYSTMILSVDASACWMMRLFKGANCNGLGNKAEAGDAKMEGCSNKCIPAGLIGSTSFKALAVTVNYPPRHVIKRD